jgi:hypothetical protein
MTQQVVLWQRFPLFGKDRTVALAAFFPAVFLTAVAIFRSQGRPRSSSSVAPGRFQTGSRAGGSRRLPHNVTSKPSLTKRCRMFSTVLVRQSRLRQTACQSWPGHRRPLEPGGAGGTNKRPIYHSLAEPACICSIKAILSNLQHELGLEDLWSTHALPSPPLSWERY